MNYKFTRPLLYIRSFGFFFRIANINYLNSFEIFFVFGKSTSSVTLIMKVVRF
jgi:hypothetical protein